MRILRIAVENKRWDLVAHTIVLATATVLENGHKTGTGKEVPGSILLKTSTAKRTKKAR